MLRRTHIAALAASLAAASALQAAFEVADPDNAQEAVINAAGLECTAYGNVTVDQAHQTPRVTFDLEQAETRGNGNAPGTLTDSGATFTALLENFGPTENNIKGSFLIHGKDVDERFASSGSRAIVIDDRIAGVTAQTPAHGIAFMLCRLSANAVTTVVFYKDAERTQELARYELTGSVNAFVGHAAEKVMAATIDYGGATGQIALDDITFLLESPPAQ